MVPLSIVGDNDCLRQVGVGKSLQFALQHPQELQVCVAIVDFAELVPDVRSLARYGSLHGYASPVGRKDLTISLSLSDHLAIKLVFENLLVN